MTQRITLPGQHPGTKIVSGIVFTDGVATVRKNLAGPKLDFLVQVKGATVVTLAPEGQLITLDNMTVAQLREFAGAQEPPIELTATRQADIREQIEAEQQARADARAADDLAKLSGDNGTEGELDIEQVNDPTLSPAE
jgi:hypothetical protein